MATIKRKGLLSVLSTSEITTDRYGLSSGAVVYKFAPGELVTPPSTHPDDPRLYLDRFTHRKAGAFWEITAQYCGVLQKTDPVWEVSTSTSAEPIETHPDFFDWIVLEGVPHSSDAEKAALTKDSLKDWAKNSFDSPNGLASIGPFRGFPFNAPLDLGGVRNHFIGRQTVRRTYYTNTKPAAIAPATINTPPRIPYNTPDGRNYLYMGANIRVRGSGKVFEITDSWDLSGPKGWNAAVYPTST